MKRRMLSLLLCLCLAASLFVTTGATAFAEEQTQKYTVALGDTLITICDKCGIDYNKNLSWILQKNNLKDANALPLGKVLTLPAKGQVYTASGSSTAAGATYSVPTQTYTMQNGDAVIKVCEKLGVDFHANEAWIKAANNIGNWSAIPVGKVLVLPAKGTKPALSTATPTSSGTTSTTPATSLAATTTTTAATTTASSTGTTLSLLSGDSVRYYLVNYSVKSGDTLGKICSAYGVDIDTVQKLNNIKNAAKIYVGQNLSIPSTSKPASGSFTAIVQHRVTSGETVQNIAGKYGMALDANLSSQIKALNNKENLNKIQVGEALLLPVKGTVTAATTGTTAATTGSTTTTGGTAASGSMYYTLNMSGTSNGTYSLTVNGQAVNGASANQTVHVVTTPDHGFKLGAVTVTKAYNGETVKVDESNNFLMPACDVKITVVFSPDPNAVAHSITASSGSAAEAKLTFVVNGYTNTTAEPGQTVQVKISKLNDGYLVDAIYVTTKNGSYEAVKAMGAADKVSVNSDFTFTMPAADAYVTVHVTTA